MISTKTVNSENTTADLTSSKFNIFVLFYGMIFVQTILLTIHIYIPVFLFNVLDIDRGALAISQIFSYSAFLIQPILSIYFDKKREKTNLIIFLSVLFSAVSYAIFIITLNHILIFGVFLGITFGLVSILDVAIDKVLVKSPDDEVVRGKNIQAKQLGGIFGAIVPNVLFLTFMGDINSISAWNSYFASGFIVLIPFVIIMVFFRINKETDALEEAETPEYKIPTAQLILMCAIIFLIYSDAIYEYPLEPWIVDRFGSTSLSLYSLVLIIFILLNAVSVVIATKFMKKQGKENRKKVFIIATIITGVLHFLIPISTFYMFIGVFLVFQLLYGFLIINMISYMMDISKKKVFIFEVMVSFIFIGKVVFVPLGTYLSLISTEILFVIVGALYLLSIIFMLQLDDEKIDKNIPKK